MHDCDCDCSCHLIPIRVCIPKNECCHSDLSEMDCEQEKLESEFIQKQHDKKDYGALESQFLQLQNDFKILSEQKLKLENELNQKGNEDNTLITNLRIENDKLIKELKEKELLNSKLFGDNNNLFHILE